MLVPEIKRQQDHISQVDKNHTLLPIALDCLKDKDSDRPSAHQLCERVADLKGRSKYRDSAGTVEDKDSSDELQAMKIHLGEFQHLLSSKENEIQRLRQEKDQQLEERERERVQVNQQLRELQLEKDEMIRENAQQIEEKERQLARVNQQLEVNEQAIVKFERRISELEQQLTNQREEQMTKSSGSSSGGKEPSNFQMKWREGWKRVPFKNYRWCNAVAKGNTVYAIDGGSVKIHAYDVTSDSWSQLPDCVHKGGSIAVINGLLTTIGGHFYESHTAIYSNELFSLTGEGSDRRWTKELPPMPTKRRSANVLCTGNSLVVAAGVGVGERALSMVEVINTNSHQWSTASRLPEPMFIASATVCGNQLYMLGGKDKDYGSTKSVYTCSMSDLLQSCHKHIISRSWSRSIWRQIADLPVTQSTGESFHCRLLAVGGYDTDLGKSTTAVYAYNSTTNSWEIISHMTTGRYQCFTAVLPDKRLMVMGGYIDDVSTTDQVEAANVCT